MPEEKDRFQQSDRHDSTRFSIDELERLFAFFKKMIGADAATQAKIDRATQGVQTNTAEIANETKP